MAELLYDTSTFLMEMEVEYWDEVSRLLTELMSNEKRNSPRFFQPILNQLDDIGCCDENVDEEDSETIIFPFVSNIFLLFQNKTEYRKLLKPVFEMIRRSTGEEIAIFKSFVSCGVFEVLLFGELKRTQDSLLMFYHSARISSLFADLKHVGTLMNELVKKKGRMIGSNARGYRRIFLTVQMLPVILCKLCGDGSLVDKLRHRIRIYFSLLPDPYISKEDVEEFIICLLDDVSPPEVIRGLTDAYAGLFRPESEMPYAPRSLKHLSCCRVRDALIRHSRFLPELVEKLSLPQALKELVLLGDYLVDL